jgi:hypothetical protein
MPHCHALLSSLSFKSSFLTLYIMARHLGIVPQNSMIDAILRNGPVESERLQLQLPQSSHDRPFSVGPCSPSSSTARLSPFDSIHCATPCPDVICACGILHWIEERVSNMSKWDPLFSTCCGKGKNFLPSFLDPPESLYSFVCLFVLFTSRLLSLLVSLYIHYFTKSLPVSPDPIFYDYATDNL